MSLEDYLGIGRTVTLGSHLFLAEEIKAFARQYDPQPFHLDEKAAAASTLGGLCASGWHTASMWMKYNVASMADIARRPWQGPGERPQFGPSPGFEKLKWLKPVFAGETITFTRRALELRALASRPGWQALAMLCEAFDSSGDKVLEFQCTVLVQTG